MFFFPLNLSALTILLIQFYLTAFYCSSISFFKDSLSVESSCWFTLFGTPNTMGLFVVSWKKHSTKVPSNKNKLDI